MSTHPEFRFPAALSTRLQAAGVRDTASMAAAFAADPALKQEYEAFTSQNEAAIEQAALRHSVQALSAVRDRAELSEFWQTIPGELEDEFVATVEQRIAEAHAAADTVLAAGLRERLDGILELQQATGSFDDLQVRLEAGGAHDAASLEVALTADPQLSRDFEAFVTANQDLLQEVALQQSVDGLLLAQDDDQLAELWQQIPVELEDALIATVERRIAEAEQTGEAETAAALRARLAAVVRLRG